MTTLVSPSLLSADFSILGKEIEMLNRSEADWLHLDIMDGVFVPNISFGMPVIKKIRELSEKTLDVHLMIVQPERYISKFREVGADILCVHYEAVTHLHRAVQEIHQNGMKAGVALNPHTPVSVLEDIIPDLDMVLIMSVNPGFGGQSFIPQSLKKIRALRHMAEKSNPTMIIQVDGGASPENVKTLVDAGANCIVAGSAVFKSASPENVIHALKHPKT